MNKLKQKIQVSLGKISEFFNRNIYIEAVKNGVLAYTPFTVIASVFLIIGSFPIPSFLKWMASLFCLTPAQFTAKLSLVNNASLAIGGVIVLIGIANSLADQMKLDNIPLILTSLVCFLLLTPYETDKTGNMSLSINNIGAQAIFLAILTSILTALIYRAIVRRGIEIKLPSSVPPAVARPFESIVPALITITTFWIIRLLLDQFTGRSALSLINETLGQPIKLVGGSLFGVILANISRQFLWFFGIHGDSIVGSVYNPVLQVLQDGNKTATLAGKDIPSIVSQSSYDQFFTLGILGLTLAMLIVARSKEYKALLKVALVPHLFNIGEPITFGTPIILNFSYFIPFILTPICSTIISYFAFSTGIVPIPNGLVQVPWTTPPIIAGVLVTGSWKGGVLQLVCLIVATLIWIPFVKAVDKTKLKVEQQEKKA